MPIISKVLKKRKGFSMIEMMGVIIILAIMTAGVTLSVHKMGVTYDKYSDVVILHDMVSLQQGIGIYRRIYGSYPKDMGSLLKSGVIIGDPNISKGNFFIMTAKNDPEGVPEAFFKDSMGKVIRLNDLLSVKP